VTALTTVMAVGGQTLLASGSYDGTVRPWDPAPPRGRRRLFGLGLVISSSMTSAAVVSTTSASEM
jgi:hypothetical protein